MMVWIAEVSRDRSMPLDQAHVALYGYFPQVTRGEARPYVWRLTRTDTMLVASHMRPSANSAREVFVSNGITYDFRLSMTRISRRSKTGKQFSVDDHDVLKRRVTDYAAAYGGDVRFVRITGMMMYHASDKGVRLPICAAVGKVYIRDAEAFDRLLCQGSGRGKAYGLGLWYLPEIMEARHATA